MYRVKRISSKKPNPCPAINAEWNECCYITRNGKIDTEKNQGGEHQIFQPRPKEVNRYHKNIPVPFYIPIFIRFIFFFVGFIYYTNIMLKGLQYFICRSHMGQVDFYVLARKIFNRFFFYSFRMNFNTLRRHLLCALP